MNSQPGSYLALIIGNLKNMYSKSLSWSWNLNFPPVTVNNKFKFQAQDSNLEYFFLDLEIWKTNRTFWIKATFTKSLFLFATMGCIFVTATNEEHMLWCLAEIILLDSLDHQKSHMYVQAFLDFCGFDFRDFWFNAVYNYILFSSPLVLLSNLYLCGFCFRGFYFVSPH